MQICAIIAEYNPFHNGHKYMINKVRKAGGTHVVAVMSGNFVQRGDVAICDKYSRTRMAIEGGADLVIELPITYAAATAQRFAHGAVALIKALGCVDTLAFGSECGNQQLLDKIADAIDFPDVIEKMKENLALGMSFASARQSALEFCGYEGGILQNANDTLAVCYIDEIYRQNACLDRMAIKRKGVGHDGGIKGIFASASAIRNMIADGDNFAPYMPMGAADVLQDKIDCGQAPMLIGSLDRAFMAKLRSMSLEDIANLPDISEGLENRIYKAVRECGSVFDVADAVKSKRYTHARIRRILLSALLGIDKQLYDLEPQYIRVLGFNDKGREILAAARPTLPIITRAKDVANLSATAKRLLDAQSVADGIAVLAADSPLPHPDDVEVVIV